MEHPGCITVFVCIGFMLAILYIDLMFDVMAVPHRRSGTMGQAMVAGIVTVIPRAQRLASGKDPAEVQTRLIRGVFTAHVLFLVCILVLAAIQLVAAGRGMP